MRRKLRQFARRKASRLSLAAAATAAAVLAAAAPVQAAPHVYVGNPGSNNISQYAIGPAGVLSPLSPPTVAAGRLAGESGGVAVSPGGESVYVTNRRSISQYDVGPGGKLSPKSPAYVAADISPNGLAVSPDGHSVYVTITGNNTVNQYDVGPGGTLSPKTPASVPAGNVPARVAVSPDGQSAYVTTGPGAPDNGRVSQYDIGPGGKLSPKSPARVAAGISPGDVAVSPDGQSVYVTNYNGGTVSQYDVGPGGKLSPKSPATVGAEILPRGIAVSPDGHSVYVALIRCDTPSFCEPGAIAHYDVGAGGTLSFVDALETDGFSPEGAAVNPDGHNVYVTNSGRDTVSQYGVGVGGVLEPLFPPTVAAGHHPAAIAVSPPFPVTRITRGPRAVTNDPTPTFGFSSSEPGSTFRCKLGSSLYSACNSPKTTQHLADGTHTFYVRATDPDGNVDPTPARRTFTVRTAFVRVSGSALVVTAAPGATDNLQITRPSASIVRVTDFPGAGYRGSGVHAGAGCTRNGDYTANCLSAAITPALPALVTSAGQQGDRVVNSSGLPSSLYGGAGNDLLIGGSGRDILNGGTGVDVLQGLDGNDLLQAHDGTSDMRIDCGARSDKADLDLLPKDANVKGCEAKRRH
jgi:DNA-binding beta-propeller fold protein YncE